MRELSVLEYDFATIPDTEIPVFTNEVINWYAYIVIDENRAPAFSNDMLVTCRNTQESFGNYFFDIQQYEYMKKYSPELFHPEVFPIDVPPDYWDEHMGSFDEYAASHLGLFEGFFLKDMKRVLDICNMFYTDGHSNFLGSKGNKLTYHNIPIKGVW